MKVFFLCVMWLCGMCGWLVGVGNYMVDCGVMMMGCCVLMCDVGGFWLFLCCWVVVGVG